MTYDNTNSGVLFPENNVEGKQPHYTGKINVNGKDYRIAGWKRMGRGDRPFLSLKISEPRPPQKQHPDQNVYGERELNNQEQEQINLDDIPF